jgi:hypothetical protein
MWKINMIGQYPTTIRGLIAPFRRALLVLLALTVATVPILVLNETVSAAQITDRSLQISSARAGATANYTFSFIPAQTTPIQSIQVLSCTTALGACTTPPSGISLGGSGTLGTVTGFGGSGTFAKDTTSTGCTGASVWCMKRTSPGTESLAAHTFTITGATNQDATNCSAAPNCTFFERITTYSDNYTTSIDSGTTASSTTQLFTVNAEIEEELSFCIGNTAVNDATSVVPNCTTISGTSLNLGVLGSADINISPVATTNGGDNNNGLAELNTNASNGANIDYDAVQQSGTNHQGALRVSGATCNSSPSNTDQCINSVDPKSTLTAGTEAFGMTVAGINCSAVTAYTCNFSTGTTNLTRASNYNCDGTNTFPTTDFGVITGTSHCDYMWDESGTQDNLASSTAPVGNEALILKFAATPNLVTPTGSYAAEADFVAVPAF